MSVVGYGFFVFAAPPGPGGYNPGETLDPECAPGQLVPEPCIVQLLSGSSITADNGLTIVGSNAQLGGTLIQNTVIDQDGNDLNFTNGNFSFISGYNNLFGAQGFTQKYTNGNMLQLIGLTNDGSNSSIVLGNILDITDKDSPRAIIGITEFNSINLRAGNGNASNGPLSTVRIEDYGVDISYNNGATTGLSSYFAINEYGQLFESQDFNTSSSSGIMNRANVGVTFYSDGSEYTFPRADGLANQVLTTDGAGQLSWTTVSGGSLPSQTGHAGEYLTTDGTNASWTTIAGGGITSIGTINSQTRSANGAVISGNSLVLQTGNGILPGLLIGETTGTTVKLGVNAGLSAVTSLDNVFIGINAGQEAASITDEVYIGHWAGYQATNSWSNNYIGRCAGCYSSNNLAANFIGSSAGSNASLSGAANFFGNGAGANAVRGSSSTFIGNQTGESSQGAANAIFIGTSAGRGDQLTNYLSSDSTVPTVTYSDTSILIGHRTSTGNFKNSIAIGAYATNTGENQFMIGSTARPINEVVIKGSGTCSIVSTGISCSSDERLKTNITDLENTILDTVSNIRTVRYNWNSSPTGNKTIGFLAQDLEQYYPELVRTDADGFKMVNYAQMTPILVEAIREMNLNITQIANISETNTWRDSLIAWFGNIENGITKLFVKEIESEVIKTKDIQADKLCLEDICVTKDQLQQLLQQGQMSNNDNIPTVTVTTDPDLVIPDTSPVDPGNTDPVLDGTSNSTDQDIDQTTVADDVLTEQPPE